MRMAAATRSSHLAFLTTFQRISMVFLSLLLVARVDAQNDTGEVQTLLQIRAGSDVGSSWQGRMYWATWNGSDTTPCDWWGVTCTPSFTVQQLNFSSWGLIYVPNFTLLSNLPDLSTLDLSSNNFQNEGGEDQAVRIPESVGSLAALMTLDLSRNAFSGPIPASISACQNLRYINFGGNSLTEIPDLSGLKNLQYVFIKMNNFSGQFPSWVGKLTSLLSIDLSGNLFNGTIPSLSGLTNMVEVNLDNNSFTGFEEPIFPGSRRLKRLDVHRNKLQGPIPLSLTEIPSLRNLDLCCNNLTGTIPTNFSINMSESAFVNFQNNQLTGTISENLLQPTPNAIGLRPVLVLKNNNLTGPIPLDGTKQYHYDRLDLSNNSLSGHIPSICTNGSSFIGNLTLHHNQLEGDIVDFLTQCYTCFVQLQLANNSFSGDLSRIAANMSSSTTLDIVTRESKLVVIDLSNNSLQMSVSEAIPDPLRGVLEYLVLNTGVTKFLMPGNNFSGTSLPTYLSSPASSLQTLDLSNNGLKGEISQRAFNSTWLPALQFLNLSNNVLTGHIPQATVLLPKLKVLNLKNNSLSGVLPAGLPPVLNANYYFADNDGLCGYPLKACGGGYRISWWILFIAIGGPGTVAVVSCLAGTWRWRKYHKLHQQDADLIKTLLERESATLMSHRDLKKATSNFADSAEIGKGGFGTVYVGKLNDGTVVAIKKSKYEGLEKGKDTFLNEVRILSQVSHRHLVKLLGCCMENKTALLVFEFVSNGTLQEHLQGKIGGKRLSWEQRLSIAIQTADALNYLHTAASFPIYHRDVKSANILLDNDLNAKVADFGISRLAPALEATHVSTVKIQGTVGYMDPEYYASYQLTDKSDVYSLGVVLLELISAKPAVDFQRGGEETSLVHFANLQMETGDMRRLIDVTLMDTYDDKVGYGRQSILNVGGLAMKCLHTRSKVRPSMREVWKELQNILLQLQGLSTELIPISDDALAACSSKFQDLQHDDIFLLADSFSGDSSSFTLPTDGSIQLSQPSQNSGSSSSPSRSKSRS